MNRTTIAARAFSRIGAAAVTVALVVSITALPASAGTPPTISGFSPGSGPVGSMVTITGTGFTGATSVRFNGTWTAPNVNSDIQITATVPTNATTGLISVTTPGGTDQSATDFVVTGSLPRFSDFNPKSGPVGTTVVIDGNHYLGATAVRFNGTPATFTVNSATRITTTVPAGATTGRISVTTGAGTAQTERNFTVSGTGLNIHDLSPNNGPVGTSVTINGSGFSGVTSVRFNGTSASFSFVSANRVDAVVPSGATTGRVTLTTPAGTATSPGSFTVTGGVHQRSISLFLGRGTTRARLFAIGNVSVNDGYSACQSHVPVVIKRFRRGGWRWVTTTSTGENGSFRAPMANKGGRYRARALRIELVNGAECAGQLSNVVRHHR